MKKTLLSALILVCLSWNALSQSTQLPTTYVKPENSTGVDPVGTYSGVQENFNLCNDNLNVVIPLFTLKGRNGMDFQAVARYNSKLQEWVQFFDGLGNPYWSYEKIEGMEWGDEYMDIQLLPTWKLKSSGGSTSCAVYWENLYILTQPDGTRHEFLNWDLRSEQVPGCTAVTNEIFSTTDSSHMQIRESKMGTHPR